MSIKVFINHKHLKMKYYKKHLLHALFTFCLLCIHFNSDAQCSCNQGEYTNYCPNEKIISATNGANITNELYDAITNHCKIRIKNTTTYQVIYKTNPLVFHDINHKEIILDQNVILEGVAGSFSDCSQSILTFDGDNVHDILIRGDYCEGETKPTIGMGELAYQEFDSEGALVGADNIGDPYLDNFGQPNYVYSDGDSDPYFDNNGVPNFIGNGNQPQVFKDCEYNDFLCNRKIIVWCPYAWEARHIISLQGVENFWIRDLNIDNASGGDGIHITDDRDFNVASNINLTNLDFNTNVRNGLKITNASCVDLLNVDFYFTGVSASLFQVDTESAFNIDQNTSPGSVDDFMGTFPNYALDNINLENVFFKSNFTKSISIDIPINLTSCSEEISLKATNVCISQSDEAIVFEKSNESQGGIIKFNSVSLEGFGNALSVSNVWESTVMNIGIEDWHVNNAGVGNVTAFDINSPPFCSTASVNDICKSSSILDDLCIVADCITPDHSCLPNQDPKCGNGGNGGNNNCELIVTTEVEEIIEVECECDYVFMIDESQNILPSQWASMKCSVAKLMNDLEAECEEPCDTRFSLIQWEGTGQQNLSNYFECAPFNFDPWGNFINYPDVGDAIKFLHTTILGDPGYKPNEECFKVIILTAANCPSFEFFNAGPYADMIKDQLPNTEFFVVDYTLTGELEECAGVNDVIDDEDGNADPNNIIQGGDCNTGIGITDFEVTSYTYTIYIEIDPACVDPTIIWTSSAGGQILTISPDKTIVTVNGEGYYTVEVVCASGCNNAMTEDVMFDNTFMVSNPGGQSAFVSKDEVRYSQGSPDLPYKIENSGLSKQGNQISEIQISPNPFRDILHIQLPQNGDDFDVKIFSTHGQLIYNKKLKSTDTGDIDLSNLTTGLYIVKLLNTNTLEIVTHKVLKMTID